MCWLYNPATGNDRNVCFGWGAVYCYDRNNTTTPLVGFYGNNSDYSPLYIVGTFQY